MNKLFARTATVALVVVSQASYSAESKFPGKGVVTIGAGPMPLLVHYVDGSGKTVQVKLRDIHYAQPDISKSKELNALAKSPCGAGDVINIPTSAIGAETTGVDVAGIGRFVWLINGQYTSDGKRWQFKGTVKPKDDKYDFNKGKDGERAFWAEVSTRIGSTFPGKEFSVRIAGSLPVSITGVCNLNSAGEALV